MLAFEGLLTPTTLTVSTSSLVFVMIDSRLMKQCDVAQSFFLVSDREALASHAGLLQSFASLLEVFLGHVALSTS